MRILFWSDAHLTERQPIARSQDYCEDMFAKIEEVRQIARTCDYAIFGGDCFHRPQDIPHRLVRRVIEVFQGWPCPMRMCVGNHDLTTGGMRDLGRTALGVVLQALDSSNVGIGHAWVPLPGVSVVFHHWQADTKPEQFRVRRHPSDWVLVQVTHEIIMPPGGGWPFPAIGMDEIDTEADVVLLGHTHWETGVHRVGQTLFVGPGAVARTQRSQMEMGRVPKVVIISLEKGQEPQAELVPLRSARPAEEVFAWTDGPKRGDGLFAGYVAALETGMALEGLSVEEAVATLEGRAAPDVVAMAREYLSRAGL